MGEQTRGQVRLDEYPILDGGRHPFAVICPGGGYEHLSLENEGSDFANELNARGCAAFVLHYRVGEAARWPAPMEDLARAVASLLERADALGLESGGYSVWGSSAGGHLAACFGAESLGWAKYGLPRPGALALCYPVITMGPLTHPGSRLRVLGPAPTGAQQAALSAEKQVTAAYPPAFVWWGEADDCVDPANSRLLLAALEKAGVACKGAAFAGVGHGVGLGRGLACEGWLDQAVEFWLAARR